MAKVKGPPKENVGEGGKGEFHVLEIPGSSYDCPGKGVTDVAG